MKIARLPIAAFVIGLVPAALFAQSTISGVVNDSSGAVVANATVTASSDVLIERSKTVTTNGEGRYAIIDLRPGTYVVTATAPGFDTVRQSVDVPSNITVPVDATLRPGSVGETVNVEARVATVDVENAAHPETLSRSEMDALPTARYMQAIAVYVPGAHLNLPDIGGSQQIEQNYISVHGNGSVHDTYLLDGMLVNTTYSDGQIQQYIDNGAIQESTYQTSNVNATASGGGMLTNLVPKEGGNTFHADFFGGGSGGDGFWQGNNLDANLKARNLAQQNSTVKIEDFNGSVGGPIIKDKLWFMLSGRTQITFTQAGASTYPDGSAGIQDGYLYAGTFRLTYQLNQKNKFTAFFLRNWKYKGHEILDGGQTGTPFNPATDSTQRNKWPMYYILQSKWTATPTAKLVTEAGLSISHLDYNDLYQPGVFQAPNTQAWYANTSQYDATAGRRYVAGFLNQYFQTTRNVLFGAATYVNGSHQIKIGAQWSFGPAYFSANMNGDGWNQFGGGTYNGVTYNNSLPLNFNAYDTPFYQRPYLNADLGLYAMDTWHFKRLSINYGVRFEYLSAKIQVEDAPAGRFAPVRHVPETTCSTLPGMGCWKNWTPRIGIVYDVFGNHKTAVKAGFGKYNTQYSTSFTNNFNPMTQQTLTVPWTAAGANLPQCVPIVQNGVTTPNPNCFSVGGFNGTGIPAGVTGAGTLGASTNPAFGTALTPSLDPNFHREYNLQYTLGVQHELRRGITLNFNWYRRSSYEGVLLLNTAVDSTFWQPFTIQNPLDGTPITVYNYSNPNAGKVAGVTASTVPAAQLYQTNAPRSLVNSTYMGYETAVTARLSRGIFAVFGWTVDRTLERNCAENSSLASGRNDPNSLRFCDMAGNLDQNLGAVPSPPWAHEFKVHGSIPIKWGVQASTAFYSHRLQGSFAATGTTSVQINNGYLARTWTISPTTRYPADCKCTLAGQLVDPGLLQGSETLNLVAPGQVLSPRLNELDFGVKRPFKLREKYTFEPEVQWFNLMNSNAVITQSTALGGTVAPFLPGGVGGSVSSSTPPRIMRIALLVRF